MPPPPPPFARAAGLDSPVCLGQMAPLDFQLSFASFQFPNFLHEVGRLAQVNVRLQPARAAPLDTLVRPSRSNDWRQWKGKLTRARSLARFGKSARIGNKQKGRQAGLLHGQTGGVLHGRRRLLAAAAAASLSFAPLAGRPLNAPLRIPNARPLQAVGRPAHRWQPLCAAAASREARQFPSLGRRGQAGRQQAPIACPRAQLSRASFLANEPAPRRARRLFECKIPRAARYLSAAKPARAPGDSPWAWRLPKILLPPTTTDQGACHTMRTTIAKRDSCQRRRSRSNGSSALKTRPRSPPGAGARGAARKRHSFVIIKQIRCAPTPVAALDLTSLARTKCTRALCLPAWRATFIALACEDKETRLLRQPPSTIHWGRCFGRHESQTR